MAKNVLVRILAVLLIFAIALWTTYTVDTHLPSGTALVHKSGKGSGSIPLFNMSITPLTGQIIPVDVLPSTTGNVGDSFTIYANISNATFTDPQYVWNTTGSCPDFSNPGNQSTFIYASTPSGATDNCTFTVSVSDILGDMGFGQSANLTINSTNNSSNNSTVDSISNSSSHSDLFPTTIISSSSTTSSSSSTLSSSSSSSVSSSLSSSTTSSSTTSSSSTTTNSTSIANTTSSATSTISGSVGGGGSTSGGGGAGGGGGLGNPTISRFSKGYIVSNISQLSSFGLSLCGTMIKVTDNFITPSSSGLTINNSTYLLTLNQPLRLTNISGNCYTELVNISYLPILVSVTVKFSTNSTVTTTNSTTATTTNTTSSTTASTSGSTTTILPITNFIYRLSSNQPLTINLSKFGIYLNLTGSPSANVKIYVANVTNIVPAGPKGLEKISAFNVSITSVANITTNMTLNYPCYQQSALAPYELKNGTWLEINQFTTNPMSCSIKFTIPNDPIVALFWKSKSSSSIPTTSAPTSSYATTTIPLKITVSKRTSLMIEVLAIIAVVVAIVVMYPRYKRRIKYGKLRYVK